MLLARQRARCGILMSKHFNTTARKQQYPLPTTTVHPSLLPYFPAAKSTRGSRIRRRRADGTDSAALDAGKNSSRCTGGDLTRRLQTFSSYQSPQQQQQQQQQQQRHRSRHSLLQRGVVTEKCCCSCYRSAHNWAATRIKRSRGPVPSRQQSLPDNHDVSRSSRDTTDLAARGENSTTTPKLPTFVAEGIAAADETNEADLTRSQRFVNRINGLAHDRNFDGVLRSLHDAEAASANFGLPHLSPSEKVAPSLPQNQLQSHTPAVDIEGYNACLGALAQGRRWLDAVKLLCRMEKAGVRPDYCSFERTVAACYRANEFGQTVVLRRQMQRGHGGGDSGDPPSPPDWAIFQAEVESLKGSGGGRKWPLLAMQAAQEDAQEEQEQLSESQKFVKCIQALSDPEDVPKVMQLLRDAEMTGDTSSGVVDVDGYNACLHALARARSWKHAMNLLDNMEKVGVVKPDYHCYDRGVEACCRAGEFAQAAAVREKMRAAGILLDWSVFQMEIKACGAVGNWQRALELLAELRREGIALNSAAYDAVMDAFARSNQWRAALIVLREMKAAGWELGVRSYRGAIISAAKAGACDAALDLLGEMQASRVELTEASPGIYNTVAIACAKADMWHEASGVLEDMTTLGMRPNVVSYNAGMAACARAGQWRKVHILLEKMQKFGIPPDDYTFSCLIAVCGKAGRWDQAVEMHDEMKRLGIRATAATFNSVISVCGKPRVPWERAVEYLGEMLDAGVAPNSYTVTTVAKVLGGCGGTRRWARAVPMLLALLWDRAGVDGVVEVPNLVVADIAITAYAMAGRWRGGMEVLEGLKRRGVRPDARVYNALIVGLVHGRGDYWTGLLGRGGVIG